MVGCLTIGILGNTSPDVQFCPGVYFSRLATKYRRVISPFRRPFAITAAALPSYSLAISGVGDKGNM